MSKLYPIHDEIKAINDIGFIGLKIPVTLLSKIKTKSGEIDYQTIMLFSFLLDKCKIISSINENLEVVFYQQLKENKIIIKYDKLNGLKREKARFSLKKLEDLGLISRIGVPGKHTELIFNVENIRKILTPSTQSSTHWKIDLLNNNEQHVQCDKNIDNTQSNTQSSTHWKIDLLNNNEQHVQCDKNIDNTQSSTHCQNDTNTQNVENKQINKNLPRTSEHVPDKDTSYILKYHIIGEKGEENFSPNEKTKKLILALIDESQLKEQLELFYSYYEDIQATALIEKNEKIRDKKLQKASKTERGWNLAFVNWIKKGIEWGKITKKQKSVKVNIAKKSLEDERPWLKKKEDVIF